MNSKQYVIFLLCLLLFSMVWSLYSGEREKDLGACIVSIDYLGRATVRPPENPGSGLSRDDDPHTQEESLQEPRYDSEEYHDEPEKQGSSDDCTNTAAYFTNYRPLWQTMLIDGGKIAVGSCAFTGLALFILDRLVERSVINDVLAKYHKSVGTISSNDAKLMHMAYRIDEDGLHALMHQMIGKHGNRVFESRKRAWVIPALAELYFDDQATPERISEFVRLMALSK